MENKEKFKAFVRERPELITHVNNGSMTWQKFYEMWDLYGDQETAWEPYRKKETTPNQSTQNTQGQSQGYGLQDLFNMIKKVDSNTIQKNITNIQKAIALVQELTTKEKPNVTEGYNPRPIYKHFED